MMNSLQGFLQRLVPSRNIVVLFALCTLSTMETFVFAQQNSSNTKKSTSLMLQFFGPEALGIHVNHNATQWVSLNAGLGADLGVHLGANAYLTNRNLKRFACYGGLQLYFIREFQFASGNIFGSMGGGGATTNKRETQIGVYIPIGFEFIAKKGFTLQLDLGPNFIKDNWGQTNTGPIMGSLKIGYTFPPKIKGS